MFADFLATTGMGKQAAALANRVPWFADSIVLAGLLNKPLTKRAAAPTRCGRCRRKKNLRVCAYSYCLRCQFPKRRKALIR